MAVPVDRGTIAPRRGTSHAEWDLLLLCVAGYVLTSVGRVHELFPGLQSLRPTVLTGGLAVLLYVLDSREGRRLSLLVMPTTKYLLAFFAWMVLSIPGSLWEGNSFDLVFGNFVKTLLMYVVLAGAVQSFRDVERLAIAYFAAVGVYAAVVVTRFDVGAGDWRLSHLYYYDANDFATLCVTAMSLGFYAFFAARRVLIRLLVVVGLVVITIAFVRSGSRGGFLAFLAVLGFIVLRYRVIPLRWRLSATALVTIVLLAAASEQYWTQMGTIGSETDYNRTEESGRLQVWGRGVTYMVDHPVLGVGANNFPVAEGTLSPIAARQQLGLGVKWGAAHNSFIQVGAELGFPGLILFIGMIASAFGALRRAARVDRARRRRRPAHAHLSQALTASLIAFVVGAFFLSLAYAEMLYTLIALAAALLKVTRLEAARLPRLARR